MHYLFNCLKGPFLKFFFMCSFWEREREREREFNLCIELVYGKQFEFSQHVFCASHIVLSFKWIYSWFITIMLHWLKIGDVNCMNYFSLIKSDSLMTITWWRFWTTLHPGWWSGTGPLNKINFWLKIFDALTFFVYLFSPFIDPNDYKDDDDALCYWRLMTWWMTVTLYHFLLLFCYFIKYVSDAHL